MNIKLYKMLFDISLRYRHTQDVDMKEFYRTYGWSHDYSEEKNKEYILKENNLVQSDLDLIANILKSKDREKFVEDYVSEEFSKLSQQEISDLIYDYIQNERLDYSFSLLAERASNNILDRIGELDKNEQIYLIENMNFDEVIKYINNNGVEKDTIIDFSNKIRSEEMLKKYVSNIDNETDKIKIVLKANLDNKAPILPLIKTRFFRNLVIHQDSEFVFETDQLLDCVDEYNEIKKEIESKESEEEKTKIICEQNNNDVKMDFLQQIKSDKCRKEIIESLSASIDPRLESQVELVQKMIREFFEDSLREKFDKEKRERLDIVFNRTKVYFSVLEGNINGKANCLYDDIQISSRHNNSSNTRKLIGFLAHEYSHLLSKFNYKSIATKDSYSIEEGMADTFADLVINHYIQKHNKIELDGKRVAFSYPYEAYSAYDFENAWARTILYGLTKSEKDIDAVAEYVLGDKRKFAEMVYGKEVVEKRECDGFGIPNMETSISELYYSDQLDFSEVNNIPEDSLYAKRNYILPVYKIQSKLNIEDVNLVEILQKGKSYYADFVGNKYFDNKKLYEIPREEMQEFHDLLVAQTNPKGRSCIIDYYDFYGNKLDELTKDEINDNSFQILDSMLGMYSDLSNAGEDVERVCQSAFSKEIELIQNGQNIKETIYKYKTLVPDYLNLMNGKNGDCEKYILDYINDFKYECLGQMRQQIESGEIKPIVEALKNEKSGKFYFDEDIKNLFNEYNYSVKEKIVISPITNSAVDATKDTTNLGELKEQSIKIENIINMEKDDLSKNSYQIE